MSLFESPSGSEGVPNTQTEPFPVLVSLRAVGTSPPRPLVQVSTTHTSCCPPWYRFRRLHQLLPPPPRAASSALPLSTLPRRPGTSSSVQSRLLLRHTPTRTPAHSHRLALATSGLTFPCCLETRNATERNLRNTVTSILYSKWQLQVASIPHSIQPLFL